MKKNKSNWRQGVSISQLPKMLVLGIMLVASSLSFSQSAGGGEPMARMTDLNEVTVRTGLHASYKIPCGHFAFGSKQEAIDYFQSREVDYINFVVLDAETVFMNFDLNNPAVSAWTLSDWNLALAARAATVAPRVTSNN